MPNRYNGAFPPCICYMEKVVNSLPTLGDASRNNIYILPDESLWILNFDGDGYIKVNVGGGSTTGITAITSNDGRLIVSETSPEIIDLSIPNANENTVGVLSTEDYQKFDSKVDSKQSIVNAGKDVVTDAAGNITFVDPVEGTPNLAISHNSDTDAVTCLIVGDVAAEYPYFYAVDGNFNVLAVANTAYNDANKSTFAEIAGSELNGVLWYVASDQVIAIGSPFIFTETDITRGDRVDLQAINQELANKQNVLVAGDNIVIDNTNPLEPKISMFDSNKTVVIPNGVNGVRITNSEDLEGNLLGLSYPTSGAPYVSMDVQENGGTIYNTKIQPALQVGTGIEIDTSDPKIPVISNTSFRMATFNGSERQKTGVIANNTILGIGAQEVQSLPSRPFATQDSNGNILITEDSTCLIVSSVFAQYGTTTDGYLYFNLMKNGSRAGNQDRVAGFGTTTWKNRWDMTGQNILTLYAGDKLNYQIETNITGSFSFIGIKTVTLLRIG